MSYIEYFILITITLTFSLSIRKFVRGSLLKDILRITFFFFPFLIPILYYGIPNFTLGDNFIFSLLIAISSSILALLIQYKRFLPFFNIDFYYFFPLEKKRHLLSLEVSLLLSPLFEELIYRYYLPQINIYLDIIISGLLFSAAHYLNKNSRNDFTFKDYSILFFLGAIWYFSFSLSGSIIPAILGHLIYNIPNSIICMLRYVIPNRKSNT
ncbi:CPBP family intramembrane glutamic endopeptidase [Bacillus toyonensis]|uniref:CPBP family intramembrane glutamic endopeptidase n=1 Tax=Bacillus toyonensis TaxID=155322 RepID=UPI000BEE3271|nr:CPBP family intramembrane glutamic endopeptidase [Bacillus toyonensis]PDY87611.1 hypothetical protein CON67_21665 [Bacillus toyonensis]